MLNAKKIYGGGTLVRAGERGLVLIMVMIVMVAMMLAGVAMLRSVDTANLVAGNMGFRQAATHQGDAGVENAIYWLTTQNGTGSTTLQNNVANMGYSAVALASLPATNPTWDAYWNHILDPNPVSRPVSVAVNSNYVYTLPTSNGYTVSYYIERMCPTPATTTGCLSSPTGSSGGTNTNKAGSTQNFTLNSQIYYRITERIEGPRNTVSYVQAMVAM